MSKFFTVFSVFHFTWLLIVLATVNPTESEEGRLEEQVAVLEGQIRKVISEMTIKSYHVVLILGRYSRRNLGKRPLLS
jgi:hypothetical protein